MHTSVDRTKEASREVRILYRNHRGEVAHRRIVPVAGGLSFGANHWHREPGWLLAAYDKDKGEMRTFAKKDVMGWEPSKESEGRDGDTEKRVGRREGSRPGQPGDRRRRGSDRGGRSFNCNREKWCPPPTSRAASGHM